MKKKKALITGISGQDSAYLAKFLIEKGYNVVGGNRKNTTNFTVIKDLNTLVSNEGAISSGGIDEVTAVAITID